MFRRHTSAPVHASLMSASAVVVMSRGVLALMGRSAKRALSQISKTRNNCTLIDTASESLKKCSILFQL